MLIGPVFTRELATAPRRVRFYAVPAVYVGGLLILMCTAWLLMIGTQQVRNVGDMARFGAALFQFLAPLQLVLAVFFSALGSASAVQEKDRRTLELLLLTNLSNSELVLGKLLASMLNVLVLLAAGLPFFMLIVLFGGVSFEQILRVFAVTFVTALAAGSLGSTIALWREKTFQMLALTALALAILAAWGSVARHGTLFASQSGTAPGRWAGAESVASGAGGDAAAIGSRDMAGTRVGLSSVHCVGDCCHRGGEPNRDVFPYECGILQRKFASAPMKVTSSAPPPQRLPNLRRRRPGDRLTRPPENCAACGIIRSCGVKSARGHMDGK